MKSSLTLLIALLLVPLAAMHADEVTVRDAASLRSALRGLKGRHDSGVTAVLCVLLSWLSLSLDKADFRNVPQGNARR